MKKIKKLLALVMAMTMVLGMAISVSAEEPRKKGTATVEGVTEENAVVTAYQLVSYDEENQQYVVADAAKGKGYDVGMDDAGIVSAIAADSTTLNNLNSYPLTKENGSENYTASLEAGTYLILVTETGDTIYNPMLVSLEVEYPDGVGDGSVDADKDYTVSSGTVYAKSTDNVPTDKIITDSEGTIIGENGKYEDVYAGTRVYFTLTGTIPSYSKQYDNENLTYKLIDTVSSGLTLDADLQQTLQEQVGTAATVTVQDNVITIDYTNEYIMAHGGENVNVTYSAVVNGTASNFDAATNTLKVEYSNNPNETTYGEEVVTRHYTFDLEDILYKVDDENNKKKLSGAEFTLTDEEGRNFTATSDENGEIVFKGLKEGTYTLRETKAPTGYALPVDMEYTLTITAQYNENNILQSFKVRITQNGEYYATIMYSPIDGGGGHPGLSIVGLDGIAFVNIENTILAHLPSTGGIGTTIFTIGGCAIMIAAAALYFVNRRKSEEN